MTDQVLIRCNFRSAFRAATYRSPKRVGVMRGGRLQMSQMEREGRGVAFEEWRPLPPPIATIILGQQVCHNFLNVVSTLRWIQ